MAQEFQNMKTTHSWINLITRAPVQVLHLSFRDLHERFEASTDNLRSLRTIWGLHKVMAESRDRREPMSGTRPFPTSRWFSKIMFPVPARFPIFSKITFPIPARFPIFQKLCSRFPPVPDFYENWVPGSRPFPRERSREFSRILNSLSRSKIFFQIFCIKVAHYKVEFYYWF